MSSSTLTDTKSNTDLDHARNREERSSPQKASTCPTQSASWSFCVSLPTIAELTVKMIEFDVLSMVESGSGLKQRYRDLADSYRRVIRERSLGLRDGLDQEA